MSKSVNQCLSYNYYGRDWDWTAYLIGFEPKSADLSPTIAEMEHGYIQYCLNESFY